MEKVFGTLIERKVIAKGRELLINEPVESEKKVENWGIILATDDKKMCGWIVLLMIVVGLDLRLLTEDFCNNLKVDDFA